MASRQSVGLLLLRRLASGSCCSTSALAAQGLGAAGFQPSRAAAMCHWLPLLQPVQSGGLHAAQPQPLQFTRSFAADAAAAKAPAKKPMGKKEKLKQASRAKAQAKTDAQQGKPKVEKVAAKRGSKAAVSKAEDAEPAQHHESEDSSADASDLSKGQLSKDQERRAAAAVRAEWHADQPIQALSAMAISKFFTLPVSLIPEAFKAFYADTAAKGESTIRKGGCKALQEEYAASGAEEVMYRRGLHDLVSLVAAQRKQRVFVDGPASAGKSVALAALTAWARACGWLTLYVPAASMLTHGGFYYMNEGGGWDTPDQAKVLLRSVSAAHGSQLQQLPAADGSTTLADIVRGGLEAPVSQTAAAVDAVLTLLQEMLALKQMPVLIAIDEYNALHGPTQYEQHLSNVKKRNLDSAELRLAAALRLLERPAPANGVVLAAPSHTLGLPHALAVPRPKNTLFVMERFTLEESLQFVNHYAQVGAIADEVEDASLYGMHHLTLGNPRELRNLRAML